MERLQYKQRTIFNKGGLAENVISGMASTYGNLIYSANGLSIMQHGAWANVVKTGKPAKLLMYHDMERVVGLTTSLKDTANGLEMRAKVSNTSEGRDALTLAKDGALDALSVGFDVKTFSYEEMPDTKEVVRVISEVAALYEISLVAYGADSQALLDGAYSNKKVPLRATRTLSLSEAYAYDSQQRAKDCKPFMEFELFKLMYRVPLSDADMERHLDRYYVDLARDLCNTR